MRTSDDLPMPRRKTLPKRRGPDLKPRRMNPNSLANLQPIDAVLDGKISTASRARLRPADAKAWARLTCSERGELIEQALQIRRTSD